MNSEDVLVVPDPKIAFIDPVTANLTLSVS